MLSIINRGPDIYLIIPRVEPSDNRNNFKIDLVQRVVAAATAVIASLGAALALALGEYDAALALGLIALASLLSVCGERNPGCVRVGRVIEKSRYYIGVVPTNPFERRPFVEFPEMRLRPYCLDKPLNRG